MCLCAHAFFLFAPLLLLASSPHTPLCVYIYLGIFISAFIAAETRAGPCFKRMDGWTVYRLYRGILREREIDVQAVEGVPFVEVLDVYERAGGRAAVCVLDRSDNSSHFGLCLTYCTVFFFVFFFFLFFLSS